MVSPGRLDFRLERDDQGSLALVVLDFDLAAAPVLGKAAHQPRLRVGRVAVAVLDPGIERRGGEGDGEAVGGPLYGGLVPLFGGELLPLPAQRKGEEHRLLL